MYTVKFTSAFKKNYKLMKKRGMDISLLDDVIEELRWGKELDGKYKDHVLKGEYAGFHECHVKPDWLLIYLIENNILTLTLVNTGSHADLFNMIEENATPNIIPLDTVKELAHGRTA